MIAESGAIMEYILRRYGNGRLQPAPTDAKYDDYVHWMHYAEGSGMPALIIRINVARVGEAAAAALPRLDSEVALQLGYLNSALEGQPYILGNDLTAADIQLSFVGELAAARFGVSAYPNVENWIKRFQARPAYKAALATSPLSGKARKALRVHLSALNVDGLGCAAAAARSKRICHADAMQIFSFCMAV